jgi:hypothetical protein
MTVRNTPDWRGQRMARSAAAAANAISCAETP